MDEFKINDYISLKLEDSETNIYIKGKFFRQCKYLLLNIPTEMLEDVEEIESIDEAAESLDHSLEGFKFEIPSETEFWGHCSNLQAWAENNYDTRILHRNLAFVLLKELTLAGDPVARAVFKEEIAKRLESNHPTVIKFLILEGYIALLNEFELEALFELPNKVLIETYVSLLHNEFEVYLTYLKQRGQQFRFMRKNEQAFPVMTTIKKINMFKNPNLLLKIFIESDIYALLYLHYDFGFNTFYVQNYPEFREAITEILISGLKCEDKYIFGLSLDALVSHSFIRFRKYHRKSTTLEYERTKSGIQVKNHIDQQNWEHFVYMLAEKLSIFHFASFFHYETMRDVNYYSEFFADFGILARKGLHLLLEQDKCLELKEMAERALIIIDVETGTQRKDLPEKLDLESLSKLHCSEIKTLISGNTGKVLTETIIHQLKEGNRNDKFNAWSIFRYVGEYHALLLGEGVISILDEYDTELLELIIELGLLAYLTPDECITLAKKINLAWLINNALKIIRIKIEMVSQGENVFMLLEDYFKGVCTFIRNLKGRLSSNKVKEILSTLKTEKSINDDSIALLKIILKIHLVEPSVNDIIYYFTLYNVKIKELGVYWRRRDSEIEISKSQNAERAIEYIIRKQYKNLFVNALKGDLFFEMGPQRFVVMYNDLELEFSKIFTSNIPDYGDSNLKNKYLKFLNQIKDIASFEATREDISINKREELAEKKELEHLVRDQFWRIFPEEIQKLKKIEKIVNYQFYYLPNKKVREFIEGLSKYHLAFSLGENDLILFSGSSCKLNDDQVRHIFKILVLFPTIIRLNLNFNNFQTLPKTVNTFEKLEYLELNRSGITSFPEDIHKLKALKHLILNSNHLIELPQSIGDLVNLNKLSLSYNKKLISIPPTIGNLNNLEYLGLSNTLIEKLPGTIGNLSKLNRLAIDNCPIERLPESIGGLKSLEYLHMPNSKIQTLPDSMNNLDSLKYIQVSNFYNYDLPKLRALVKPLKDLPVRIGFHSLLINNRLTNELF